MGPPPWADKPNGGNCGMADGPPPAAPTPMAEAPKKPVWLDVNQLGPYQTPLASQAPASCAATALQFCPATSEDHPATTNELVTWGGQPWSVVTPTPPIRRPAPGAFVA